VVYHPPFQESHNRDWTGKYIKIKVTN